MVDAVQYNANFERGEIEREEEGEDDKGEFWGCASECTKRASRVVKARFIKWV